MNDIKGVYDMLVGLIAAGRSPEQAEAFLLQAVKLDPEHVADALRRYREITESIVSAREPGGLTDGERIDPWYWGARPGDMFWPSLERYHREHGFPNDALLSLDRASTKVVSHLPPPWKSEFTGRGLVLGYVQSGKTSNFTAAIAKAADAGYRLFIVLSGLHNNLRRQTQDRLDRELVGLNPKRWFQLTDTDGDFGHVGNADAIMSQEGMKLLAVVKKNKSRLTNLLTWLSSAQPSVRANCPVLLIDDEADQASVNTKDPDADPSTINGLIRRILGASDLSGV